MRKLTTDMREAYAIAISTPRGGCVRAIAAAQREQSGVSTTARRAAAMARDGQISRRRGRMPAAAEK